MPNFHGLNPAWLRLRDLEGLIDRLAGLRMRRLVTLGIVTRTLITGMSGAGKSTLLTELAARGHVTVDTDYDGWTLPNGLWDEVRIARLLADHSDVILSGTVENQAKFYGTLDHIVLLSAPVEVLIRRVSTRTNNPYGLSPEHQAEISRYIADVEPLLRAGASIELDGRRPIAELADELERLIAE